MRCIDSRRVLVLGACVLSACHSPMPPDTAYHPPAPARPAPAPAPSPPRLPVPASVDEYERQIGLRLVQANPAITYTTPTEAVLLAVVPLRVEVDARGNIRGIEVLHKPSDEAAADTVQIAVDALRRAAPFGDPTRLARPWKFNATFLFDHARRFKPRVLD